MHDLVFYTTMIAIQSIPALSIKPDESTLIQALRAGCPDTFKQFYKMYSAALLGIIARIVKSEEVAEDLLQEAFIKIWNSIDRYDTSRGRLFTWMASMTRNLAIDYLRSKAHLQYTKGTALEELSVEQFDHHQTAFNPDTIGIKNLAGKLKLPEKEILDLIYFKGFTHLEAAETLNLPLGTVKTRLRRAIQSLRSHFEIDKLNTAQSA